MLIKIKCDKSLFFRENGASSTTVSFSFSSPKKSFKKSVVPSFTSDTGLLVFQSPIKKTAGAEGNDARQSSESKNSSLVIVSSDEEADGWLGDDLVWVEKKKKNVWSHLDKRELPKRRNGW